MDDPALFEHSLRCLWDHHHPEWGDRTELDVFNRLLAKNARPGKFTPQTHLNIQPSQVTSRRELWSTQDLAQLPRLHNSTAGVDCDCPIVIAEYEGKALVLDGNHRINRWVQARDSRLHDVHIHNIAIIGEYVEFPPLSRGA
jgi:hypothetical protein